MTESVWDTYPANYRTAEVSAILEATRAGESVSVVGLSGAGKSNLMGFLAHRQSTAEHPLVLVDGNRLAKPSPAALFRLIRRAVDSPLPEGEGPGVRASDEWEALDLALSKRLSAEGSSLALLLDRFDALAHDHAPLFSQLRALRDAHKYRLAFVIATRRPLEARSELAELVYAHMLWLGPLSEGDARWNVARYAARRGVNWDEATAQKLMFASGRYPALLRAASEAHAEGCALDVNALAAHPAVQHRVAEFWADAPTTEELRRSGLTDIPLLKAASASEPAFDTSRLTAKENLLLQYFLAHPEIVCEKDDLIRAVWPEDKVFMRGVRDDSLAQLVRRLREKIEPDPANPRHIHTAPGRGYKFEK